MKRYMVPAVLVSLAMASPAFAQSSSGQEAAHPEHNQLSQQDRSFLEMAARDNMGEIQMSVLAEKEATDPAVAAFARLMVDDHALVENQIGMLARVGDVTLPTGTSEQGRTTLSRLQNLHGAQFDRDFMNDQIKAHESVLKQFHQEMTSTQDMRLKAFTMLTAPTLREHLALARAVDNALKSSQS